MINKKRRLKKRIFLSLVFAVSLFVSLAIGHAGSRSSDIAAAQSVDAKLSTYPLSTHVLNANPLIASQLGADQLGADQWMQRGFDRYQTGDYAAAIADWENALTQYQADNNLAQIATVRENLARAYRAAGQTSQELQAWEQARLTSVQAGNPLQLGRVLTEQGQAYSRVGQYSRAIRILCSEPRELAKDCRPDSALGIARSLPQMDLIAEVAALGSLGDAYRLRGDNARAIFYLEQGLAIARTLQQPIYLISMLNSLGNAQSSLAQLNVRRAVSARQIQEAADIAAYETAARESDRKALAYFQESLTLAQTSGDRSAILRAMMGRLPVDYRSGDRESWEPFLQQTIAMATSLPDSQEKVYALIDLARFVQRPVYSSPSAQEVAARSCNNKNPNPRAEALLQQAIASAQSIRQSISQQRAQSYALGELGHLYECQENYDRALQLTRQAQLVSDQGLEARDSLYLWQWQLGRILKSQNKSQEAIAAYEESLATLEALRQDILTANQDIQFDFRETVEPIYRELVELRLDQESPSTVIRVTNREPENLQPDTKQGNISLALKTLDNLKLAELQNYFGNDCVLTALNPVNINFADNASQTAVFNTIVLDDRVAVILSIPTRSANKQEQTLQQYEWVKDQNGDFVNSERLVDTLNQYREGLELAREKFYDPTLAAKIYDWVIRPFEPLLLENEIKTLVFVQDGIFRSVPMASLYDGSAFLIEKYAVAMTPSVNLTNLERADRSRLRALAVGLTERATVDGTVFPALRYVNSELEAIQQALPRSVELRNQAFTLQRFEQALAQDSYPIIHIATHGKFSAEADRTFLVTGYSPEEPNQKLTLNELDDIIRQMSSRNPLELLVLSACQTATGDDRAALGLAGIAAQAGAKRVLASLWSVNDRATTELIAQFYQGLSNLNLTKAQILQAAQRALIQSGNYAHPAYWSAFVLIGNWL